MWKERMVLGALWPPRGWRLVLSSRERMMEAGISDSLDGTEFDFYLDMIFKELRYICTVQ